MGHTTAGPDAEIVKVTNRTAQWDDDLAWYSPSVTQRIYFYEAWTQKT